MLPQSKRGNRVGVTNGVENVTEGWVEKGGANRILVKCNVEDITKSSFENKVPPPAPPLLFGASKQGSLHVRPAS